MLDLERLNLLLRQAGASETERLATVEPPLRDSIATSPGDQQVAREKLVLQRTGSVYYKDPTKQKRNIFRTEKKKSALGDTSSWTFNKAERFAVLNEHIRGNGSVALAQEILIANLADPLDVNGSYVPDAEENAVFSTQPNGWLDIVAKRNDVPFIRLLSMFGASQQSKDQALGIALECKAINAAQELLRHQANPNRIGIGYFMKAFEEQDTHLVTIFLTSIIPLHTKHLNEALIANVGRKNTDLTALLFAHGASGEYSEGLVLCSSIAGEHVEETATILFHSHGSLSQGILHRATKVACLVPTEHTKQKFLEMLLCAGADPTIFCLQDELLKAVKNSDRSYAELLIRHGTSPDRNGAETLQTAISSRQMQLVTVILQGPVSESSAAKALDKAQLLDDAEEYQQVVTALVEKGVPQNSLHKCLAQAVNKGCGTSLAPFLISHGANLDYDKANCIRTALHHKNETLLRVLLTAKGEPSILCQVLPIALKIQSPSERVDFVNLLLEKGVSGKELHISLHTVVADAKEASDYRLIALLLQHKASLDFFDNNENCVCTAAAREDERALDILAEGNPNPSTVLAALGRLPLSFAQSEAAEYERTVGMVRLLLEKGAVGDTAAKMLVKAVQDDYRGKVLALLLDHGANANYDSGKAIQKALLLDRIEPLQQLCSKSKLEKATVALQLPNALNPKGFTMEKAKILVQYSTDYGYKDVLDLPLLHEIQTNGSRKNVVELLLTHGASVNYQAGKALQHAVSKGDLETVNLLLSATPTKANVARAFPGTMMIKDLSARYTLMEALLRNGKPGMGDEALLQISGESKSSDLSHVKLLLQYKASPDFRNGASVLEAIQNHNLPLLDLFISTKLHAKTLTNAFNMARLTDCTRKKRHQIFSSLLKSGYPDFNTSQALIEVVQDSPTELATPTLLLEHGASVNHEVGLALKIAASSGSLPLLNILLPKKPHQTGRDLAFEGTIQASLEPNIRKEVYQVLLDTGISRHLISEALLESTRQMPVDQSLLSLLINFKASLDYQEGGAMYNIVTLGNVELLKTLLKGEVTTVQTLSKSFSASMRLKGEPRLQISKQLLEKTPGVSVNTTSYYLAEIVQQQDYQLLELMMKYEPDPSHSLVLAAKDGDKEATALLTTVKISVNSINEAFEAMLDSRAIQRTPHGLHTAQILLPLGDNGIRQDLLDRALLQGFETSVDQKTKDLVELLIPYKPNFSGGNGKAFVAAANDQETELFRLMATKEPNLDVVIPALILNFRERKDVLEREEEAAQGLEQNTETEAKPSTDGQIDKVEEFTDDIQVSEGLNQETTAKPTEDGAATTLKAEEQHEADLTPEETLLLYLQHLEECAERGDQQLEHSILFTAIAAFPESRLLVNHLLDHGCLANSTILTQVDPSGKLLRISPAPEPEQLTALIWILSREEPAVDDEVVLEILKRDQSADISYSTPTTHQSATILASAGGRTIVLKRLVEIGVDLSKLDAYDHSPSFYASRNGHKETVEILYAAGARFNDGSLHEAAREGYSEIVEFLLASGHRKDYPSDVHADGVFGRTALEELCLNTKSQDSFEDWKTNIRQCIAQLLPENGMDVDKTNGGTMLHLALHNTDPLPITRTLLEFTAVWEHLNHPIHLYQDNSGYFYSPTKYVEFFCMNAAPETRLQLVSLLRARKCEDKFYAHTVLQPQGAVGLPEDITFAVDKQKREDHEHSEAIKRQNELSTRKRAIEKEDHQKQLASDKERHDRQMKQQREQEESEKSIAQRKHTLARNHAKELRTDRESSIREENRLKEQGLIDAAERRRTIRKNEQASELHHAERLANQEYAAVGARLKLEYDLINARDEASRIEAQKIMDILKRREATARYEAEQRGRQY